MAEYLYNKNFELWKYCYSKFISLMQSLITYLFNLYLVLFDKILVKVSTEDKRNTSQLQQQNSVIAYNLQFRQWIGKST